MSDTPDAVAQPLPSKRRVLVAALTDLLVDLLLPTAIFALLAPTGLSAVVRLTIGGFFVAGKACAGHVAGPGEGHDQRGFVRAFVVGALIAALCTALTVALIVIGRSDSLAIIAGAGVLAAVQGVRLLRVRRHLDGLALLVLLELAASVVLTSISNDPRFVLMRPSFYTLVAGVYVFSTVWSPRPFMMQVSKPMAAGGDPVRAEAFERAGRESLPFRRAKQAMTIGLALVLLGESALRVVVVLSHPASDVIVSTLWSQAASISLFVVYFAFIKTIFIPRASREVDAIVRR